MSDYALGKYIVKDIVAKTGIGRKVLYTSNSIFTVPEGVKQICISACAAGGAPEAGEFILDKIYDVMPGQVIPVIVGMGNTVIEGLITLIAASQTASLCNNKLGIILGVDGVAGTKGYEWTGSGTHQYSGSPGIGGYGGIFGFGGMGAGGGSGSRGGGGGSSGNSIEYNQNYAYMKAINRLGLFMQTRLTNFSTLGGGAAGAIGGKAGNAVGFGAGGGGGGGTGTEGSSGGSPGQGAPGMVLIEW